MIAKCLLGRARWYGICWHSWRRVAKCGIYNFLKPSSIFSPKNEYVRKKGLHSSDSGKEIPVDYYATSNIGTIFAIILYFAQYNILMNDDMIGLMIEKRGLWYVGGIRDFLKLCKTALDNP